MPNEIYAGDMNWRDLFTGWRNVAQASSRMHYEAQRRYSWRNSRLGGVATLLTALVGATAVKEISGPSTEPAIRWVIGAVAAVAGVLTALHTFFGFAARTANHRSTAAGYAAILRRIDEGLTFGHASSDDARKAAESIRATLDALSRDAPEVPADILAKYRTPSLAGTSPAASAGA